MAENHALPEGFSRRTTPKWSRKHDGLPQLRFTGLNVSRNGWLARGALAAVGIVGVVLVVKSAVSKFNRTETNDSQLLAPPIPIAEFQQRLALERTQMRVVSPHGLVVPGFINVAGMVSYRRDVHRQDASGKDVLVGRLFEVHGEETLQPGSSSSITNTASATFTNQMKIVFVLSEGKTARVPVAGDARDPDVVETKLGADGHLMPNVNWANVPSIVTFAFSSNSLSKAAPQFTIIPGDATSNLAAILRPVSFSAVKVE